MNKTFQGLEYRQEFIACEKDQAECWIYGDKSKKHWAVIKYPGCWWWSVYEYRNGFPHILNGTSPKLSKTPMEDIKNPVSLETWLGLLSEYILNKGLNDTTDTVSRKT